MALGDVITGQSCTYVLAASIMFKADERTPQRLARAPKIPSSVLPVPRRLKLHNLLGGVILAD